MENGRTKVWLSPINGGSYTRLRIVGTFPTALPVWEIRQLVERMSFFNGYPLECVLSVGKREVNWCEWWTDLLASIPVRHLRVCYKAQTEQKDGRR